MLRFYTVCCILLLSGVMASAQTAGDPRTVAAPSPPPPRVNVFAQIAESHTAANVPTKANFDKFLRRDLTAYFAKATGKKVIVKYELLRDGPTQSGVAYPKYYLWVKISRDKTPLQEGAVRVAAIQRRRFEVTHYLSKVEIAKRPEQIEETFSVPVAEKIRQKIK